MTEKESSIQGQCLCGAVGFEAGLPEIWAANCHCTLCRRAGGAPFVTWVGFDAARLRVVRGEKKLGRYRSSPEATRSFCKRCGSPLFFESSRWAGEIHVTRAALPDDAGLAPTRHSFYSNKAPWLSVHDDLPKHGGSTGKDPLDGE